MKKIKSWIQQALHLLTSTHAGLKLVSLLVAILLWSMVLGSRVIEVTKDVPLEILTAEEVTLENPLPQFATFKLAGPKAFLRAVLDRPEEPIQINLTQAKPSIVNYRILPEQLRLPIGIKVVSIQPPSLLIRLEKVLLKEVPVRVELQGQAPEGFQITRIEVIPQTVQLKGAESHILKLSELSAAPIDLSQLGEAKNGAFQRELSLDVASQRVQLISEIPKILIEVETVHANFKIKEVDIHVLTSLKATIEEKNVTVLVKASHIEEIQKLDRTQVFGEVDLRGKRPGRYREFIRMNLPKQIQLVKVIPSYVHVVLEDSN